MSYIAKVIAAGATLHWPLDDPSGAAVSTIGSKNGTYDDTLVTRAQAGPPKVAGVGSTLIPTDGAKGAGVNFANGTGLPSGNSDRTFMAWFKTPGASGCDIFSYGDGGTDDDGFTISTAGTDIDVDFTTDLVGVFNPTVNPEDGNWHHIAVRYADGDLDVWLDGQRCDIDFGSVPDPLVTALTSFSLGGPYAGVGQQLNGNLSSVSVFPTALDGDVIQDLSAGDHDYLPQPAFFFPPRFNVLIAAKASVVEPFATGVAGTHRVEPWTFGYLHNAIVEPFSFGVADRSFREEPFDFGEASFAKQSVVESWTFGQFAGASVAEPFDFGTHAYAKARREEPFDFGSSGSTRGPGVSVQLGATTPSPASPLIGWRDR